MSTHTHTDTPNLAYAPTGYCRTNEVYTPSVIAGSVRDFDSMNFRSTDSLASEMEWCTKGIADVGRDPSTYCMDYTLTRLTYGFAREVKRWLEESIKVHKAHGLIQVSILRKNQAPHGSWSDVTVRSTNGLLERYHASQQDLYTHLHALKERLCTKTN